MPEFKLLLSIPGYHRGYNANEPGWKYGNNLPVEPYPETDNINNISNANGGYPELKYLSNTQMHWAGFNQEAIIKQIFNGDLDDIKWNHEILNHSISLFSLFDGDIASYEDHIFYSTKVSGTSFLFLSKNTNGEWDTSPIGNFPENEVQGSIATYPDHVFYKGNDKKLHLFKLDCEDDVWEHIPIGENWDDVTGDIAAHEDHVFYRGEDGRIVHSEFSSGNEGWSAPEFLGNANNVVKENIISYHKNVYYHGIDDKIHRFYKHTVNDDWQYQNFWQMTAAQKVGNDLVGYQGNLFYKGLADDHVHRWWFDNDLGWTHEILSNPINNNHKVHNVNHQDLDNIAVYPDHISYKGANGSIHHFYYTHDGWKHGLLNDPNHQVDNAITTYKGNIVYKKVGPEGDEIGRFWWGKECSELDDLTSAIEKDSKLNYSAKSLIKENVFDIYPNPSDGLITIDFTLANEVNLDISIYNSLGQKISSLIDESLQEGTYQRKFVIKDLQTGVYFVKFESDRLINETKKIIIKSHF